MHVRLISGVKDPAFFPTGHLGLIPLIPTQGRLWSNLLVPGFRGEGGKLCNRRVSPVAVRPGEGRQTEPTAAARLSRQQRRLMAPQPTFAG
jgi:hypothetical protein